MGVFATPDEITSAASWDKSQPLDVNDPAAHAGFFDEAQWGIPRGIGSGVLAAGNLINRITPDTLRINPDAMSTDLGKQALTSMTDTPQEASQRMLDFDEEGQGSMGTLGHITKGISKLVTEGAISSAVGIPAPVGIGAMETVAGFDAFKRKGVDTNTSLAMGAAQGFTNSAFAMLPGSLGLKSLIPDLAASIGLVDVVGAMSRGLNSQILESGGYPDMAKQYHAFDAESIISDTLLAGVFHGIARKADYAATPLGQETVKNWNGFVDSIPTMPWRHVDDALVVSEARHQDTDTAPGIPTTPEAFNAHLSAMREIDAAVAEGRVPNFDDTGIFEAGFLHDPAREQAQTEAHDTVAGEIDREIIGGDINNLSEGELFAKHVGRNVEIDPIYADGSAHLFPAVLDFYGKHVAHLDPKGSDTMPDALFRIGEVNDSVSAGLHEFLPEFNESLREARISAQSIKHIHGSRPSIARAVLQNLEQGVLRADEVLPNPKNTDRALIVLKNIESSSKKAKHSVTVLEVSANGKGIDVVSAMTSPDKYLNEARKLAEEQRSKGLAGGAAVPSSSLSIDMTQQHHPAADFPKLDQALDPTIIQSAENASEIQPLEIQAAQQALVEHPDLQVGIGEGVTASAHEAMAQHDAEIAQAHELSNLIEVAATCALRK